MTVPSHMTRRAVTLLAIGMTLVSSQLGLGREPGLEAFGLLFQAEDTGVPRLEAAAVQGFRIRAVAEDSLARIAGLREGIWSSA